MIDYLTVEHCDIYSWSWNWNCNWNWKITI